MNLIVQTDGNLKSSFPRCKLKNVLGSKIVVKLSGTEVTFQNIKSVQSWTVRFGCFEIILCFIMRCTEANTMNVG